MAATAAAAAMEVAATAVYGAAAVVALSGRSLRRTLRVQVVAEGLAHPLVTWSTLALDVFPAWSPAWFTISRKKDRGHRTNSGYSRATSSPSRLSSQSVFAND